MAINSIFYLNAADLATATAVYLDLALTNIAPDGFYGEGTITRQQSSGILLPAEACATCATPCGTPINGSGNEGVYLVNLDAGNSIGAVIIRFDPYGYPDGIRAVYNGVTYNKLTSPVDGLHQSTNPGHYTFVGNSGDDCGISGATYPALQEFLYVAGAFTATGLTQSLTVASGDVSLSASDPGNCMMVIPKASALPSLINIQMVGPCGGTAFTVSIACPVLLTGFSSSSGFASSALSCAAVQNQTYYNASLSNTSGTVNIFDFVYLDNIGSVPLANGFYKATGSIAGGYNWFQVTSGVVVAVGGCGTLITLCNGTTTTDVCCDCDTIT